MNYEKKYNEALNWMRELYPGLHGATKEDAEHYFPELRESEDERIRRELVEKISNLACGCFISQEQKQKFINYLEKQKEPKHTPDDLQKSFEAGQASIVDNPEQYGLCKKPAWSEEDERIRKWCISHFKECFHVSKDNLEFKQYLNNKIIPWLEKQKPLEWSDKDEKMKESIIKALYGGGHFAYEPEITWLKSLRPRSKQIISEDTEVLMVKLINLLKSYRIGEETATTLANRIADTYGTQRYMDGLCDSEKIHWKPSEEQLVTLLRAEGIVRVHDTKELAAAIAELYEELKKRM